jgi:hypothetical protein
VFYHLRRLRGGWTVLFTALYYAERQPVGRHPHPSAAIYERKVQTIETLIEMAMIHLLHEFRLPSASLAARSRP